MYDVNITHIQSFKGTFSVEPVLASYTFILHLHLTLICVSSLELNGSLISLVNYDYELLKLFWNARIIQEKRKSREEIDGSCTLLRGVRFFTYLLTHLCELSLIWKLILTTDCCTTLWIFNHFELHYVTFLCELAMPMASTPICCLHIQRTAGFFATLFSGLIAVS